MMTAREQIERLERDRKEDLDALESLIRQLPREGVAKLLELPGVREKLREFQAAEENPQ